MNTGTNAALIIMAASGLLEPGQMERSQALYAEVVGRQTHRLADGHRTTLERASQAEANARPNRAQRRRTERGNRKASTPAL